MKHTYTKSERLETDLNDVPLAMVIRELNDLVEQHGPNARFFFDQYGAGVRSATSGARRSSKEDRSMKIEIEVDQTFLDELIVKELVKNWRILGRLTGSCETGAPSEELELQQAYEMVIWDFTVPGTDPFAENQDD